MVTKSDVKRWLRDLGTSDREKSGRAAGALTSDLWNDYHKPYRQMVIEICVECLGDEDSHIRANAAKTLQSAASRRDWSSDDDQKKIDIGTKAIAKLTEMLSTEKNLAVLGYVINALGCAGVRETIPKITEFIENKNYLFYFIIINTLQELKGDKAIDCLVKMIDDSDHQFVEDAILALGGIGSDRALDILLSYLSDEDKEPYVFRALRKIHMIDEIGLEKIRAELKRSKNKKGAVEAYAALCVMLSRTKRSESRYEGTLSSGLPKPPARGKGKLVRAQRRTVHG